MVCRWHDLRYASWCKRPRQPDFCRDTEDTQVVDATLTIPGPAGKPWREAFEPCGEQHFGGLAEHFAQVHQAGMLAELDTVVHRWPRAALLAALGCGLLLGGIAWERVSKAFRRGENDNLQPS